MANSLNIDLTNKVVVFEQDRLSVPALEHLFLVRDGFGCVPYTAGSAIVGTFLSDGEEARMGGFDVERLATDEEIARMPFAHLRKENP